MNIVGKILVLLNLVFAVATGGFLAVDFATRTNWKTYAEGIKREMDVGQAQSKASTLTNVDLNRSITKLKLDIETERQLRKDDEIQYKVQIEEGKSKLEEANLKLKDADLTGQQVLAAAARLRKETQDLLVTIKKREEEILDMQKKNKDLRVFAALKDRENQTLQERNEKLLNDYQALLRQKLEGEKGVEATATVADGNRPNPPSVNVKGVIDRIDTKDPTLVEISLGSDQGLKKYNTLEVFRLNPRPEYLGTIRVVDVYNHKSVARMMRTPYAAARGPLRPGDHVASKIGN
ncbi:MAG: hypothetical protein FJ271_15480 [Planctomycetes bacterium]|nr:hypothetical protein [Planctomycetota bacterium]